MNVNDDFDFYIARWDLVPEGDPIVTRSSRLLPVRRDRQAAMLKIAVEPEEKWGAGLMIWWNGIGAARVIEHDDDAVLLERATGRRSLADMANDGDEGCWLTTGATNWGAQRLYLSLGFEVVDASTSFRHENAAKST